MPTIKKTTALAANGSANPLQGSQYEFAQFDALIEAAIVVAPGNTVEANMFSGSDLLLENAPLDEKAATLPVTFPDDVIVQDVVAAGERIGLTLRETGGAVASVRTAIRITPL